MRICYVVLSPTFGMYQVTADLANHFCLAHEVHLLAAQSVPRDRFAPPIQIHPLTNAGNSGVELASLDPAAFSRVMRTVARLEPDLVHFSAPHVWNLPLILWLKAKGVPIVYTLHDLDPHHGTRFSRLMRLFNHMIVHQVDRLFVYGKVYKRRLVAAGVAETKITVIPLLHLFLSYKQERALRHELPNVRYEPFALFFGRLEPYKGVEILLQAFQSLSETSLRLVLSGQGDVDRFLPPNGLPCNVEVRNRHIADTEAVKLFRTCGLLVLPYIDATQSALVSAAYFFRKPVIVTRTGALPEYVEQGQTGFVVEPRSAEQLASCILKALSDAERLQTMGEAGHQWYLRERHREHQSIEDDYTSAVGGQ